MTKNDAAHVPGAELEHMHPHGDDLHPILRFVGKNWKPIAAGLGAVIVIIAGVAVYDAAQKSSVTKVQGEIAAALAHEKGADRLAALEKILADGPGKAKNAVLFEVAKASLEEKDFARTAKAWEELAANSVKDMRAIALLGEASALSKADDNAKALEILNTLQGDAPKTFELIVIRQTAVTAEAAGDAQKAIASYERLLAEGNLPNKSFLETKIEQLKAKVQPSTEAKS